jgi:hypothetical protein
MAYIPTTSHATLLATLQRQRLLQYPGEVAVQENQRVDATTIIVKATVARRHRLVDIARGLGVPPKQIDAFLVKHDGDAVKKDELLATRRELFLPRDVVSPVEGVILAVGEGKALIAVADEPVELRAGVSAAVKQVVPDYGATLEITGALLEGVWGNGQEAFGVIQMVGGNRTDSLTPALLEMELRGALVAVGVLQDTSAFARLAEVGVRGLVVGSMRASLIPEMQRQSFPVLVVEGFGTQGFSSSAHTLLGSNAGREAWINAQAWDRFAGHRPEVIIPLPSPSQAPAAPADGGALAPGLRVRIIRGPGAPGVGQVLALSEDTGFTASGVRAHLATVQMEEATDAPVTIAFANLEILE